MLDYSKCKIVIVEDEPVYLDFLNCAVEELFSKISIYNSDNGAFAYSLIKEHKPDLIITDWDLPQIDGIKLTDKVRKTARISHIPVIMLTGKKTDPENLNFAFSHGVSDFITKPFNKIEFFARVKSQLLLSNYHQTINKQKEEIKIEKEKSEILLKNILPDNVIEELKNHQNIEPKEYNDITVFFADIVDFSAISKSMNMIDLIDELNELFSEFDEIMKRNHCERIKTVGDAYIAVSGMQIPNKDHALNIVNAACEIVSFVNKRNVGKNIKWEIRTGIHSGDIIGGIVGKTKYIYDIFGDTVNITSRLEKSSKPMKILLSTETYQLVKNSVLVNKHITINVKGIGAIDAYFLKNCTKNTLQ
ncbi:MAG: response regulator [Bacteroidetes bacterium]|nr:response regulator [Bacteroidota bacterium]